MASNIHPVPIDGTADEANAALQRPWRMRLRLSRAAEAADLFLGAAGFDRGPWLAAGFLAGIACWFILDGPAEWIAALLASLALHLGARAAWQGRDDRRLLLLGATVFPAVVAAGLAFAWARSELVGVQPIERPMHVRLDARVLERQEQPAQDRIRLVLATRETDTGRAIRIRLNLDREKDRGDLVEGALIRVDARLMPPAPPALPGAYNFARAAWFKGLAATGSVTGDVQVLEAGGNAPALARIQRSLSAHVRTQLSGSPGTIAAALASGDRGAIAPEDEEAMRNSGLTHLLSISGLHVSAVVAGVYFLAIRLLALWPWLALRVRLPLAAAAFAALAGVGYTLLTGSEVPTVRSCIGALLVLLAIAIGREPLSLRMVAVAAMLVLLLWPEALVSPGFQMSFASVLAIVSLHSGKWCADFLARRESERFGTRMGRRAIMLLVTGVVIELALMPIGLFHFHRAGVYGALANVIAIPLVTFISMPLIALALLFDLAAAGKPVWWLAGKSIEALLELAHWVAAQPGAVKALPAMTGTTFFLFVAGGLWLALWRGRVRMAAIPLIALATGLAISSPRPDLLIMADGAQVGIVGDDRRIAVLRESRSSYTTDNLVELSGATGQPVLLNEWPGAQCSADFCTVTLRRGARNWHVLMARNRMRIEERALSAACEQADIVVAPRWLPRSCKPRWLKADRDYLEREGGVALFLATRTVRTVADGEGRHGWWRPYAD